MGGNAGRRSSSSDDQVEKMNLSLKKPLLVNIRGILPRGPIDCLKEQAGNFPVGSLKASLKLLRASDFMVQSVEQLAKIKKFRKYRAKGIFPTMSGTCPPIHWTNPTIHSPMKEGEKAQRHNTKIQIQR